MAKFYLVQKSYGRISLCDHSRIRLSIQKIYKNIKVARLDFLGEIPSKFEHQLRRHE